MKTSHIVSIRWTIAVILLFLSFGYFISAISCWWAAGGPPNPDPEKYLHWGNFTFALSCLLFVGFVVLTILNIKYMRKFWHCR